MLEIVTNYYDVLNINSELSTDEINIQLSKLETIWKRREITNPEKAAKMNALIIDARNVFKNDATRREYDVSLNVQENVTVQEEHKHTVEQWQIDAINKAEIERKQLEDKENQRFKTRMQHIEERKATTATLYKKAWIVFSVCASITVLAFVTLGFGRVPVFLLAVLLFGAMGFLNFCDMYRNGNGSGLVMMISTLGGFIFCFNCATAYYTQMGYSAASIAATWKVMGVMLVIMIATIFITRKIGKNKADSSYKQNLF